MSESAPIEHPTWLTTGDFTEADEPLRLFAAWFEEATRGEPRDPTAMSLATAYDQDGTTCRDFLASYVKNGSESWLEGAACRAGRGKWEVRKLRPWKSQASGINYQGSAVAS